MISVIRGFESRVGSREVVWRLETLPELWPRAGGTVNNGQDARCPSWNGQECPFSAAQDGRM